MTEASQDRMPGDNESMEPQDWNDEVCVVESWDAEPCDAEEELEDWNGEACGPKASAAEARTTNAPGISHQDAKYTVYSAADALLPQKPIQWIVDGLLPEDSVNLVIGEPGCKKTWVVIHMALSVAAGVPWLGRKTEQRSVLFIDEETGERWMKKRVSMVLNSPDLDSEVPCWFISDGLFNLTTEEGLKAFRDAVLDCGAGLVVIDAMVDIMTGKDENRASDGVQPVLRGLRRIAHEAHCAIAMIHHTKKDNRRKYRGTNAIEGGVDNMILVQSEDGESLVTLSCERAKNSAHFAPFAAYAHITSESFTLESTGVPAQTARLGKAQQYVLKYLKVHGPSSVRDIMSNATGCKPNGAKEATYNMAREGIYVCSKEDDPEDPAALYMLTEKGDEVAQSLLREGVSRT